MKEEFIAYLWKHRLLRGYPMTTICGKEVDIISPGQENYNSGPDFLAAIIRIGGTIWAGNVEIHVRSSQWFAHKHHLDKAYMNIILHVVYQCDKEIADPDGNTIPHLEIKNYFEHGLINNYGMLLKSRTWIACEKLLHHAAPLIMKHWLYRLLIIRLERKTNEVLQYLKFFNDHREKALLFLISRSLGGKSNEAAFGLLFQRIPYTVISRNYDNPFVLEALMFGQAGLLNKEFHEIYPQNLQEEYSYLKKKYQLPPSLNPEIWKYSRMRPLNFPDVRIAQLVMIVHTSSAKLFNRLLNDPTTENIEKTLSVSATDYWKTHYRLNKAANPVNKVIGTGTVNNIAINAIAPLLFMHAKSSYGLQSGDIAVHLLEQLPPENNKIIKKWQKIYSIADTAATTQGLLELYKYYCIPKKCLKCMLGHQILKKQTGLPGNSEMPLA